MADHLPLPEIPVEAVAAFRRAYDAAGEAVPLGPDGPEGDVDTIGTLAGLAAVYPILREQLARQWRCAPPDLLTRCKLCPDEVRLFADHEFLAHARDCHAYERIVQELPEGYTSTICARGLCVLFDRCRDVEKWGGEPCQHDCHRADVSRGAHSDAQPSAPTRPWEDLRTSGLLWLINATTFHPRGYALAFTINQETGKPRGWKLLGDGAEPWWFKPDGIDALFAAAEETLRTAPERLAREAVDGQIVVVDTTLEPAEFGTPEGQP